MNERCARASAFFVAPFAVLEPLLWVGASTHGEADLLALTVHGSGLRTAAELDAVIARAGLVRAERHTVGWGTGVDVLVPAGTR